MPLERVDVEAAGAGANIWVAASDGDVDRVRQLLDLGTSVDAKDEQGYNPLYEAAREGRADRGVRIRTAARDLTRRRRGIGESACGADERSRQAAVSYGHDELTRFLLERGANPNTVDNDDDTPLHVCETVACAQLLLDAGARIDAVNKEGQTVRPSLHPPR